MLGDSGHALKCSYLNSAGSRNFQWHERYLAQYELPRPVDMKNYRELDQNRIRIQLFLLPMNWIQVCGTLSLALFPSKGDSNIGYFVYNCWLNAKVLRALGSLKNLTDC